MESLLFAQDMFINYVENQRIPTRISLATKTDPFALKAIIRKSSLL
jgi:hypothetical protein